MFRRWLIPGLSIALCVYVAIWVASYWCLACLRIDGKEFYWFEVASGKIGLYCSENDFSLPWVAGFTCTWVGKDFWKDLQNIFWLWTPLDFSTTSGPFPAVFYVPLWFPLFVCGLALGSSANDPPQAQRQRVPIEPDRPGIIRQKDKRQLHVRLR